MHRLRRVRRGLQAGKQRGHRGAEGIGDGPDHALDGHADDVRRRISPASCPAVPAPLHALRSPSLHESLSGSCHLQERGRDRHADLSPVHRVSLLHGRVPLHGEILQLVQTGMGARHPPDRQPRCVSPARGRGGKVHLLRPPAAKSERAGEVRRTELARRRLPNGMRRELPRGSDRFRGPRKHEPPGKSPFPQPPGDEAPGRPGNGAESDLSERGGLMEKAPAAPHPDYDLLRPIENPGKSFYYIVAVLLVIILYTGYVYIRQVYYGLGVTGMAQPVTWGFYIINFVFFIGISHAGTLISAILRLSKAEWRRPITRMAEVITAIVLAIGGLHPIIDLGRPDRMTHLFYNGRLQSPLLWDIVSITAYFTASTVYLFIPMIPDIAILRDRGVKPRWLYEFLSWGWQGTEQQHKVLDRAMNILMVVVIPIAISVHTIISYIFAMTVQPGWHSTIFGIPDRLLRPRTERNAGVLVQIQRSVCPLLLDDGDLQFPRPADPAQQPENPHAPGHPHRLPLGDHRHVAGAADHRGTVPGQSPPAVPNRDLHPLLYRMDVVHRGGVGFYPRVHDVRALLPRDFGLGNPGRAAGERKGRYRADHFLHAGPAAAPGEGAIYW